jgi:hypothetical protein
VGGTELARFGLGNSFILSTFAKNNAMNFKLKALMDTAFADIFELDNSELEKIGAIRMTVDKFPGFPCRVSLQDAELGEEVILLSYQHHKTNSPYQANGPIFVRKIAKTAMLGINEIPIMFNHRLLSLRGFDKNGMMKHASVTEGQNLREQIIQIFENENISYIHIHNAKPGCFNCVVERAMVRLDEQRSSDMLPKSSANKC